MATVAEKKRSGQEFRWSVRRKTDAVMRLLRGEDLDTVARELRVEAHRLAAWRDEFMAGGAEALKARPTEPADRKLRRPSARSAGSPWSSRSGRRRAEKGGCRSNPGGGRGEPRDRRPLAGCCRIFRAPRSTVYARRRPGDEGSAKRGPRTAMPDDGLLVMIREAIRRSSFSGEGHRKVTARLRREDGIHVGRKRVLRLMRQVGLLAPQRARGRRRPHSHDGTIIPEAPRTSPARRRASPSLAADRCPPARPACEPTKTIHRGVDHRAPPLRVPTRSR
jgi:hypothetical protein